MVAKIVSAARVDMMGCCFVVVVVVVVVVC